MKTEEPITASSICYISEHKNSHTTRGKNVAGESSSGGMGFAAVRELIRLEADAPIVGLLDETERLIAGLEVHLPGLAPAIRIIADHLIESGFIYEDGVSYRACCERRQREDGVGPTS